LHCCADGGSDELSGYTPGGIISSKNVDDYGGYRSDPGNVGQRRFPQNGLYFGRSEPLKQLFPSGNGVRHSSGLFGR
jgi:hypothetical protein